MPSYLQRHFSIHKRNVGDNDDRDQDLQSYVHCTEGMADVISLTRFFLIMSDVTPPTSPPSDGHITAKSPATTKKSRNDLLQMIASRGEQRTQRQPQTTSRRTIYKKKKKNKQSKE